MITEFHKQHFKPKDLTSPYNFLLRLAILAQQGHTRVDLIQMDGHSHKYRIAYNSDTHEVKYSIIDNETHVGNEIIAIVICLNVYFKSFFGKAFNHSLDIKHGKIEKIQCFKLNKDEKPQDTFLRILNRDIELILSDCSVINPTRVESTEFINNSYKIFCKQGLSKVKIDYGPTPLLIRIENEPIDLIEFETILYRTCCMIKRYNITTNIQALRSPKTCFSVIHNQVKKLENTPNKLLKYFEFFEYELQRIAHVYLDSFYKTQK